uniref:Zinc finger MYM-type protein 1 n=1 Tax=Sipha flava TaxID=143950 RepID=A0A2S2QTP2_9HEMI
MNIIYNHKYIMYIFFNRMPPKKLSGAEFKKRRELRQGNDQKLGIRLHTWLTPSVLLNSEQSSSETQIHHFEDDNISSTAENSNDSCETQIDKNVSTSNSYPLNNPFTTFQDNFNQIEFSDPAKWPLITDKIRLEICEHGPKNIDFTNYDFPKANDGRHFNKKWFYKDFSNGEKVKRQWLIYSCSRDTIYCFPCILFSKGRLCSFSDPTVGYCDWKHLNPNLPNHENNDIHRRCYIEWKELEKRLKKGKTIDDDFQKMINLEKVKWTNIIKVVVDVILYCAKNNLALRGNSEVIGEQNSGKFLNTIELISHYNPIIADHISNIKLNKGTVSYFSPQIQNEIINLMGEKVRKNIIADITKTKYFSILFDCTPDTSHKEQMSQIIRYIEIKNGKCFIRESFIDFIITKEKTGQGLTNEIIDKLKSDGLDIKDCRGQGFDNGSNMAGCYNGVQAKISQINEWARFVPCAAHSLNLIGLHASETSISMVTFFGTVQRMFTYFSGSTGRWDKLMTALKITLKGHCDTRWSSKRRAITALCTHINDIYVLLQNISKDSSNNTETISGAKILLEQINVKFICLLHVWKDILVNIDKVNCSLQSKNISIDCANIMLKGLLTIMKQMRDTGIKNYVKISTNLAVKLEIEPNFPEKRKRKKKRMTSDLAEDGGQLLTPVEELEIEFKAVFDSIIVQLNWRYDRMTDIVSDFEFLSGNFLYNQLDDQIKKYVADLAIKYSIDLNGPELCLEMLHFKNQCKLFS